VTAGRSSSRFTRRISTSPELPDTGIEAARDLSVEDMEKAYTPAGGTMPRNAGVGETVRGEISTLLRAWSDGDQRALAGSHRLYTRSCAAWRIIT
jgi:hypothetical protein